MSRIWLAVVVVCGLSTAAYAGCVGAGIGDGCIGIPTPEHRHDYHHEDHVVIEHHHHHPAIVEHHHDDEDDDE